MDNWNGCYVGEFEMKADFEPIADYASIFGRSSRPGDSRNAILVLSFIPCALH